MKRKALAIVASFLAGVAFASFKPRTVYIHPVLGDDQNVGTEAFPFKTLGKAGQWVSQQSIGQEPAKVTLEPW